MSRSLAAPAPARRAGAIGHGRPRAQALPWGAVSAGLVLILTLGGCSGCGPTAPSSPVTLRFTVQPTSGEAGVPLSPNVQVSVVDTSGNVAPSWSGVIQISLLPAGVASLHGKLSQLAVHGVATFTGLSVDQASTGYRLQAQATGLAPVQSKSFDIGGGAAVALRFVVQPSDVVASAPITPAVIVSAIDAMGNVASGYGGPVSVTLTSASGGTLSGDTSVNASAGLATFSNLLVSAPGSGNVLTASSGGLTTAMSTPFDVSAPQTTVLAFMQQPMDTAAGLAITPAVTVAIEDGSGHVVAGVNAMVSLSLMGGATGATLMGTTTVAALNGVATFTGLTIQAAADGYQLQATAEFATAATSDMFSITPAAPSALVFTTQPGNSVAGFHLAPAVTVGVVDAFGNSVLSSTANVTVGLVSGPVNGTLAGTLTQAAAGGAATFADLSLTLAGTGYALSANSPGLAGTTSSTFSITPAAAAALTFVSEPSDITAGSSFTPAVAVGVIDAFGNSVVSSSASISLALTVNPASAALSGTSTVPAVAGVAHFANLSIETTGNGYVLSATSGSLTAAISSAFNVTPAGAVRVVFQNQPTNAVAGTTLAPAVSVAVLDLFGNVVTGTTASVTVSLAAGPGGAVLGGTTTQPAVNGVATFPGLFIQQAGTGYMLGAGSSMLEAAASHAFDITPAAAAQLAFTSQPVDSAAGAVFSPPVAVTVQDAFGNSVPSSTATVTLALNGAAGVTLFGTLSQRAAGGVAMFADLTIQTAGLGYSLTATSGSLTASTSATFVISPGTPIGLSFVHQPSDTVAGVAIAPAVTVALLDMYGNVVVGSTAPVTLYLISGPQGAAVSGSLVQQASGGIATFDDVLLNIAGAGYVLGAASGQIASATSTTFSVTPAGPSKLVFVGQPTSTVAGVAINPAVTVAVEDVFGNTVTGSSAQIGLLVGNAPGVILQGTTSTNAVSGIATFTDVEIDLAGSGYQLIATTSTLQSVTSSPFDVSPAAATQLAFMSQPADSTAGVAFGTTVTVAVEDAFGNTVPASTAAISIGLPGAVLQGTTSANAAGGIASFPGLTVLTAGTGQKLIASAASLTSGSSAPFDIAPASGTQLTFSVQPSVTTAGVAIGPAVQVSVLDTFGNVATSSNATVLMALSSNPTNAQLGGTTAQKALSGVATFPDLNLQTAGTGYVFSAAANGLTSATSASFDVVAAAPAQLSFGGQPSNTTAGVAISPAVTVLVQDSFGNTCLTSSASVTVATGNNPSGTTLLGTLTQSASSGVATFPDLALHATASGYTLTATSGVLASAASTSFNITPGPDAQLTFSVSPGNTTAGVAFSPSVTVQVLDQFGNPATGSSAMISLGIAVNPTSASLVGTTTNQAVGGVAAFPGVNIQTAGVGYALSANSGTLAGATSLSFNVNPATGTHLSFSTPPSDTVAGATFAPPVAVSVLDMFGNVVTGSTATVSLTVSTNPTGASLFGSASLPASSGVATFTALNLHIAGTGYALTASSPGLAPVTSSSFAINPAAAAQVGFTSEPAGATAGVVFTPAVTVAVQDQFGNTVPTAGGDVTLALVSNPGHAALFGTLTLTLSAGTASFTDLVLQVTGSGYTLGATAGSLTTTSAPFTVAPGPDAQLIFLSEPTDAVAGADFNPVVTVEVEDQFGNQATGSTATVSLDFASNPTGASLSGGSSVMAVGGLASFSTLNVQTAGMGYALSAASGVLTGATSSTFNVSAGGATKLAFTGQPTPITAGNTMTPAVAASVTDHFGNVVSGAMATISVSLQNNPTSATLFGTLMQPSASGTATFGDLSLQKAGTGYTLTATASGLAQATSAPFDVNPAQATSLAFSTQPSTETAGQAFQPGVVVQVLDGFGNTVTSSTATITVAFATNPTGATLMGTLMPQATAGVAALSDLTIQTAGTGYSLTVTSPGLASATSNPFDVVAGTPSQLAFTTAPVDTEAGTAIAPAVAVSIEDAFGNVTSSTSSVTVALTTNPTSTTLHGTLTQPAVAGVATFGDLDITAAASGYVLGATAGALTGTSSPFAITPGSPASLTFAAQPTSTTAGSVLSPAVKVTVKDSYGNQVTDSSVMITMSLAGATLYGTTTQALMSGAATFADLNVEKAGNGYQLSAGVQGTSVNASSSMFNISAGSPEQVAFTTQPTETMEGNAFNPTVVVTVEDQYGNLQKSPVQTISVAIASGPTMTLHGTTSLMTINGNATFFNLSITTVGSYTLSATCTSATLASATSNSFNIDPGPAAHVVFGTQPVDTVAGEDITPAVTAELKDSGGNIASTSSGSITIAISNNPSNAMLLGTLTQPAVSGIATFPDLAIQTTGSAYTLIATSGSFTSPQSNSFNITPSTATQLAFTTEPSDVVVNASISPSVKVTVQDQYGNKVTTSNASITVALQDNPGGATLSGTLTQNASSGVATFPGLSLNVADTMYTLSATSDPLTAATSTPFDVTP